MSFSGNTNICFPRPASEHVAKPSNTDTFPYNFYGNKRINIRSETHFLELFVNNFRYFITGIFFVTGLFLNSGCAFDTHQQIPSETWREQEFCKHQLHGNIYVRTELYFGLSKPNGEVTEDEFQNFINTEVTPRFPTGLTLLSGKGQFKDSTGTITKERSKLLILLYTFSNESSSAVEQIREAYKKTFQQESVMRVDEQSCVSF